MNGNSPRERGTERSMSDAYREGSLKSYLSKRAFRISVSLLVGFFLIAGLALGTIVVQDTSPPTNPPDTNPGAPDTVVVSDVNYTTAYNAAMPSVVSVYSNGANGSSSQGSGFVYDAQGHIVTNWHVISNDGSIHVRYHNGDWSKATVVGSDPYTDLAVLRVEDRPESAKPLPVVNRTPRVGAKVMALGSPDNLRGSLTVGVVSGLNRSMTTPQGFVVPDMVQTDAPLNPGNSGGPLVTVDGEVTGVNRARQGDNIGFAISGRIMHAVIPSLIEDGKHEHSLVGIRGTSMSPTVAEANNMTLQDGILVTEVVESGPSGGVLQGGSGEKLKYNGYTVYKGGDLIVAIDGQPISTNEGLTSYLMRNTHPGETVEFTIVRDGEQKVVEVTLGERPVYGGK